MNDIVQQTTDSISPVSDLSDYIKLLKDYPSSDYIFRGEHCYIDNDDANNVTMAYEKRLSGAFRKTEAVENRSSIFIRFMKRIEKYYELIGHRLSDVEREHFIAFSQHHWLPTNLLDITSAPLVALFMACDGATENGHVYIFDKDYMDVTDILAGFAYSDTLEQDFIELLINDNRIAVEIFFALLKKHISETFYGGTKSYNLDSTSWDIRKPSQQTNERICRLYNCCAKLYEYRRTENGAFIDDIYSDGEFERRNLPKIDAIGYNELLTLCNHEQAEHFHRLANGILQDECMKKFPVMPDLKYWQIQWPSLYLILLAYFLKRGRSVFADGKSNFCYGCEVESCNGKPTLLPNLVYKPKITFDRARAQQGFFIYQPYIKTDSYDNSDIALFQETVCVKEIKIEKTPEILRQLDEIGINRGTIYGDYDSIAKYIKERDHY